MPASVLSWWSTFIGGSLTKQRWNSLCVSSMTSRWLSGREELKRLRLAARNGEYEYLPYSFDVMYMKVQKARLPQPIPNLWEAIPVPTQAYLYYTRGTNTPPIPLTSVRFHLPRFKLSSMYMYVCVLVLAESLLYESM